jgi:hypothetical protein
LYSQSKDYNIDTLHSGFCGDFTIYRIRIEIIAKDPGLQSKSPSTLPYRFLSSALTENAGSCILICKNE